MRAAASTPDASRDTFWRTLQTFCLTRGVISIVLFGYLGVNALKDVPLSEPGVDWRICIFYIAVAAVFGLLSVYLRRRFMLQLLSQLTVDIVAITLLYVAAGGARSGLAILYLFPLAGAAVLAPMVLALFFVSLVTFILLAESGVQLLAAQGDASPSRAGVYGAAFFAAIYVINRLAAKLIKQEELAAQRGRDLQLQEAINQMIIADMGDGILVVDPDTRVFACNPAAERMLGMSIACREPGCALNGIVSLAPIADAFLAWSARCSPQLSPTPDASTFVIVKRGDDVAPFQSAHAVRAVRREIVVHLKLRFAVVKSAGVPENRTVIFLQDVSEIENQAQQLKLASMGRLTASIAHEVRNPLSAISHAASLLTEEITEPTQSRLLTIVGDNVIRLNRMIEDILKLSRKAQAQYEPLRLAVVLEEILNEFNETHRVPPGRIRLEGMGALQIRFDPLHLREVLFNLLSNAMRYASERPGSIVIHALASEQDRFELHVQDDGPPITPEVRAHLFEPFYTTSSKGTGLGLYVARELCLNNGAMLDYEYRSDLAHGRARQSSGRFVITFAVSDPL